MNAPFAADTLDSMKFAIGQPVPRHEDPTLLKGEGRYSDDVNLDEPGLVRDGAQPGGARHHQGHRHDRGAGKMPGVLGVWTGADLNAAGYGRAQDRDDGAAARRLADEDADALFARHRQGALRRRPGGLRRRRDAGAGQGRGRSRRRSTSRRCPPSPTRARPRSRARPWCTTTCRAMSAPTTTTATRPRSTRPSPRPRTSRGCA